MLGLGLGFYLIYSENYIINFLTISYVMEISRYFFLDLRDYSSVRHKISQGGNKLENCRHFVVIEYES